MPVGKASLITRCPGCATAFRATAAQLALRDGKVRCGNCGAVFDARVNALGVDPAPVGVTAERPSTDIGGTREGPSAAERPVLEPAPVGDPPAAHELPAEHACSGRGAYTSQGEAAGSLSSPSSAAAPAENLAFDFGRRRATRTSLSLWVAWPAATLLLLALVAQAAFSYRGELALLFPVLRPHAEALCEELGCAIPLPRRAEFMSIESSDLQADAANPGVMVLSANLRNRAPFAQTPPALELTLTDTQDREVARRVLTAADYISAGTLGTLVAGGASALIPAGTEIPVKVYFDASALKATGYRLYLFYP
ncbi:MAG: DUF3426 domain-containing protein [Betaproteobacteria bacterium]|nr:DUF3426 domain-containing protein [Betaproteobacteria bacterium]